MYVAMTDNLESLWKLSFNILNALSPINTAKCLTKNFYLKEQLLWCKRNMIKFSIAVVLIFILLHVIWQLTCNVEAGHQRSSRSFHCWHPAIDSSRGWQIQPTQPWAPRWEGREVGTRHNGKISGKMGKIGIEEPSYNQTMVQKCQNLKLIPQSTVKLIAYWWAWGRCLGLGGAKREPAKLAGIHGNPESGNHPAPSHW